VIPQVGKVRENQVYARHLLVREGHACVDQDDPALLAHGGHVFADLPQSAQGYDLQGFIA
jgi:hypothetical protein